MNNITEEGKDRSAETVTNRQWWDRIKSLSGIVSLVIVIVGFIFTTGGKSEQLQQNTEDIKNTNRRLDRFEEKLDKVATTEQVNRLDQKIDEINKREIERGRR
jgi:RNase H-fold protein (predicted Holliday junction resolvase)